MSGFDSQGSVQSCVRFSWERGYDLSVSVAKKSLSSSAGLLNNNRYGLARALIISV